MPWKTQILEHPSNRMQWNQKSWGLRHCGHPAASPWHPARAWEVQPGSGNSATISCYYYGYFLLHTYDYTYYFVCHSLANLVSGSCRVRVQDQGDSGVYLDLLWITTITIIIITDYQHHIKGDLHRTLNHGSPIQDLRPLLCQIHESVQPRQRLLASPRQSSKSKLLNFLIAEDLGLQDLNISRVRTPGAT